MNKEENSTNVQHKRGTSLQKIGCQYFSSLALTLCSDDIGFRGESKTKETQQSVSTLLNAYRIPQTIPLFKILRLHCSSGHIIPFCCTIFNIADFVEVIYRNTLLETIIRILRPVVYVQQSTSRISRNVTTFP